MKHWFYFLCIALLSACSPVNSVAPFDHEQAAILLQEHIVAKPTQQMIRITLPQKENWQKITAAQNTIGSPVMLIPRGESAANWSESIQTGLSAYVYHPDSKAAIFVQNAMDRAKKICQHAEASLLAETHQYVIYQIDMSDCRKEKNQRQIGKVLNGEDAIYMVRYVAVSGKISASEWKQMSSAIKNAALVRNPRYQMKK